MAGYAEVGAKQDRYREAGLWPNSDFAGPALLRHQAMTEANSLTIAVSPTARQTGEFLRKAEGFARLLHLQVKDDGNLNVIRLRPILFFR